jgi:hypothetical protein
MMILRTMVFPLGCLLLILACAPWKRHWTFGGQGRRSQMLRYKADPRPMGRSR